LDILEHSSGDGCTPQNPCEQDGTQARMWGLLGVFNLLTGKNTDVLPVANLLAWDYDQHGSETCTM